MSQIEQSASIDMLEQNQKLEDIKSFDYEKIQRFKGQFIAMQRNGQQNSLMEEGEKYENNLSLVTKSFIKLIKSKKDCVIDINQATRQLNIQKRRIYDITNVLEGIGYIEKIPKNQMKWLGGSCDMDAEQELKILSEQIEILQNKQQLYDEAINYVTTRINNDFNIDKDLNYITLEDCQSIMENDHNLGSLIVVSCCQGATIQYIHSSSDLAQFNIQMTKQKSNTSVYVCNRPSNDRQIQIDQLNCPYEYPSKQ